MAKSSMRVRGITIEIAADMTNLVREFKSSNAYINSFRGSLAALQKNITSDNSWGNLGLKFDALRERQTLLIKEFAEVSEKIQIEKEALANLAEADTTEEITARQEALRSEILLDKKRLQEIEKELTQYGNLGSQKALAVADAFKDTREKLISYKDDLEALERNIISDNSFSNLILKFEALAKKHELLGNEINTVKERIKLEKKELSALSKADQTPEVVARKEKLQAAILVDEKELQNLEKELDNFGSTGKQEALAVAAAFTDLGEKFKEVGDQLISKGRSLSMYVTTPVVTLGTVVTKTAMDFETAMDKVQSVTLGATADDMERLTEAALELSGESKYSASETAEALYYMGLAGWDVNEMLEALPDVLNLATAGDLDLGRASDIVTDYITAFGLSARDATDFVDTMAKTMVNSNTDVDQLGEAFKYVAPVAGALGYSVEDVSLALGLMANNGIKASQAGTSLRQFMQRLAKPTAEVQTALDELGLSLTDKDGRIKSFKELMDDLRDVLGSTDAPAEELTNQINLLNQSLENGEMSEEEYMASLEDVMEAAYGVNGAEVAKNAAILAGVRGMSGLLAIVNATSEDYDTLTEAINGTSQSAESIAEIMLDNTQGSFLKLRNSAKNLAISFGKQLLPRANDILDWGQDMVKKFSDLDDGTKDLIVRVAALAAGIGPLLIAGGSVLKAIGEISSATGSLLTLIVGHPIGAALGALVVTIGTAIVASEALQKQVEAERLATWGLSEEQNELVKNIEATVDAYENAKKKREEIASSIDSEYSYYQNLVDELGLIVDANGRVKEGYEARAQFIVDTLNEALGAELELNDHIIIDYQNMRSEIEKLIETKRANAILTKYEQEYSDAINNSTQYYHNYTDAAEALSQQQVKVTQAGAALVEAQNAVDNATRKTGLEYLGLQTQLHNAQAAYDTATSEQQRLSSAMEDAYGVYLDSQNYIANYEEALNAMASGGTENARDALNKLQYDFKTFGSATKKQLEDQVKTYQSLYEQSQKDVAAGVAGVSQEVVQGYARMVEMAEGELSKFEQSGKKGAESYKSGLTSVDMKGPGSEMMDNAIAGANSKIGDADHIGENFVSGVARGMRRNISVVQAAAEEVANAASSRTNKVLLVGSPSKLMEETGKFYDMGFALGIKGNVDTVTKEAANLANSAASVMAYNTTSPSYGMSAGAGSSSRVTNFGGVNIVINPTSGQDATDIADEVMERIYLETTQRQAVYGW